MLQYKVNQSIIKEERVRETHQGVWIFEHPLPWPPCAALCSERYTFLHHQPRVSRLPPLPAGERTQLWFRKSWCFEKAKKKKFLRSVCQRPKKSRKHRGLSSGRLTWNKISSETRIVYSPIPCERRQHLLEFHAAQENPHLYGKQRFLSSLSTLDLNLRPEAW